MNVERIVTGKWTENCYVVYDDSDSALVIDPGGDAAEIARFVDTERLAVKAILNTHAHYDHVGAVADLKERWSAPFYLHSQDLRLLRSANFYHTLFGGAGEIKAPAVDRFVDHGEQPLRIDPFTVHVLATPGHTAGGVCYLVEDHLFTGDTLLQGGIGRVDLPGSHLATLLDSLRLLAALPGPTKVLPGHGETTTMADELRHNPALRQAVSLP